MYWIFTSEIQNILPLRHRFQAPRTTNSPTTSWSLERSLLLLNSTFWNLISHISTWKNPQNSPFTKPHEMEEVRKHLLSTPQLNSADKAPSRCRGIIIKRESFRRALTDILWFEDSRLKRGWNRQIPSWLRKKTMMSGCRFIGQCHMDIWILPYYWLPGRTLIPMFRLNHLPFINSRIIFCFGEEANEGVGWCWLDTLDDSRKPQRRRRSRQAVPVQGRRCKC
jgi:hypothetical protein